MGPDCPLVTAPIKTRKTFPHQDSVKEDVVKKISLAIGFATLLLLAGCQGMYAKSEPAKPELSMEAQVALMQAEADVKQAEAKKVKTEAAAKALEMARAAATRGDSAEVVKQAQTATNEALKAMK